MAYLLGTDEAGYGPNLGPLVVSATLWRLPDEQLGEDLYHLLRGCVTREIRTGESRLPIADSKQLYKSGGGLAALEQAVLTALGVCCDYPPERETVSLAANGVVKTASLARTAPCTSARLASRPASWREIWACLDSHLEDEIETIDWFRDYDAPLPCDASLKSIEQHVQHFADGLASSDVELLAVRSRVICEGKFNALLEQCNNKADLLSRTTLELVAELLELVDAGPIEIHCDKHGGRNRYGPLLQQTFPEHLIEVRSEGRDQSVYRWGPIERRVEIRFVAGGEAALPAALASMTSKYLRELAMRAFNHFWLREVPGIKPTAGYPVDAQRFRRAIAARQAELAIDVRRLWRNK